MEVNGHRGGNICAARGARERCEEGKDVLGQKEQHAWGWEWAWGTKRVKRKPVDWDAVSKEDMVGDEKRCHPDLPGPPEAGEGHVVHTECTGSHWCRGPSICSGYKSCFSVAMTPGKTSGGLDLRVLTREGGRVIVTPHQAVMSIKRSKRQAAWWGTFLLSDPVLLSSAASSP